MSRMYLLISVYGRNIFTEKFASLEDAQEAMHKEMIEQGKAPDDIFGFEEYDDGECGLGKWSGYANDGLNHEDYDWLIVELGGDIEQMR